MDIRKGVFNMNELWKQAQKLAEENYEKEYGACTWDDADKYEREDWVFAEYEKLVKEKETNNMCERDPKTGRFVSTKATTNNNNETTNTNTNKKENDTMMNRNNAKENRMETLKANGVNTENFFDLSMRIPFGAEVKIMVDGKEMVIPAANGVQLSESEMMVKKMIDLHNSYEANNDPIAQSIINDGYVKNSKLYRRWITAQTFRMLGYVDRKNPRRKGWEAYMKDCYSYGYQFDMMADELHTLAKLQKEDPEYFAERTEFFNGDVAVALLNDYLYRLKKYVKNQMRENPRKYRGQEYVKLARYGNVLVKDLDAKVYGNILNGIANVKIAAKEGSYRDIELAFRDFMNQCYNKLPYDTTKCAVFQDAFKGAGSYYSLQNLIRFHNVVLKDGYDKYGSEIVLNDLLNGEYKNETWRFHNLLVDTIVLNKFDLRMSIAKGNAAPNTTSERAERYKF